MHVDYAVDNLDAAMKHAEDLGATLVHHQQGTFWRVMLDPAGHPFCLCLDG